MNEYKIVFGGRGYGKLYHIGQQCKTIREKLGLRQSDVAAEIGCSKENISAFECGRNNNAIIFAWYIAHGFVYRLGGDNDGKSI